MQVNLIGNKHLKKTVCDVIAEMALISSDNRIQYVFEHDNKPHFAIVMLKGVNNVKKLTALDDDNTSIDIIEDLAIRLKAIAAETKTPLDPQTCRMLAVASAHVALKKEDAFYTDPALIEDARAVLQKTA